MISIALTGVSNPIITGAEAQPTRRTGDTAQYGSWHRSCLRPPGHIRLPITDDEEPG
jgi:hypothetical protein